MIVDVIVRSQIIENKLVQLFKESDTIENAFFHKSLELLKNSLMNVRRSIILIIDIDHESSLDYFNKLNEQFEDIRFIAISRNNDIHNIIKTFKMGFLSYIDLEYSSLDFVISLSKIQKGGRHLTPSQNYSFIDWVLQNFDKEDFNNRFNGGFKSNSINTNGANLIKVKGYLTEKEKSVCEYLLKGYSYKEISDVLGISTFTINQRVRSIYRKLEVRSRSELSYKYLV